MRRNVVILATGYSGNKDLYAGSPLISQVENHKYKVDWSKKAGLGQIIPFNVKDQKAEIVCAVGSTARGSPP